VKLKITVDNKTYEVDVEATEPERPVYGGYMPTHVTIPAPTQATVPPAGVAPSPAAASSGPVDEDKVCRSPISGIVTRINAQPGQQIQVGDPLLVLEAMKMETNITAPVAGKIKQINVKEQDSVQGGQVVVEFE
jgi:methylmalonyl-CoA carboxyltransferase small subunit